MGIGLGPYHEVNLVPTIIENLPAMFKRKRIPKDILFSEHLWIKYESEYIITEWLRIYMEIESPDPGGSHIVEILGYNIYEKLYYKLKEMGFKTGPSLGSKED